jgi:hypothetical protein
VGVCIQAIQEGAKLNFPGCSDDLAKTDRDMDHLTNLLQATSGLGVTPDSHSFNERSKTRVQYSRLRSICVSAN